MALRSLSFPWPLHQEATELTQSASDASDLWHGRWRQHQERLAGGGFSCGKTMGKIGGWMMVDGWWFVTFYWVDVVDDVGWWCWMMLGWYWMSGNISWVGVPLFLRISGWTKVINQWIFVHEVLLTSTFQDYVCSHWGHPRSSWHPSDPSLHHSHRQVGDLWGRDSAVMSLECGPKCLGYHPNYCNMSQQISLKQ